MKAIQIQEPGKDYRLGLGEEPKPIPGPGEVLIKVAAAGLNNADLLQARGLYPPPPGASPILGMEVSGTIAELGEGVAGWKVGDKVCALLAGGGYARICRGGCQAASCRCLTRSIWSKRRDCRKPPSPPGPTSWIRAGLQPGESLLIHGGTSGIGSLAIQIFAARGHRIFTTAGSDEKCAAARTLGARRAINYRSEDFVEVVKAETGGKGVDVILGHGRRRLYPAQHRGRRPLGPHRQHRLSEEASRQR